MGDITTKLNDNTPNGNNGKKPSESDNMSVSRDKIRDEMVKNIKETLQLENIDLTKSSFLTYIIDTLSTLTSNLMFYSSNTYKEFFLTKAQLPESIYDLSSFLGYSPGNASYAVCNLVLTFPLSSNPPTYDSETVWNIPLNSVFKSSDGVEFITYYETDFRIVDNNPNLIEVYAKKIDGTDNKFKLPIEPIYSAGKLTSFKVVLPVRQYKEENFEFQIADDLEKYQFTSIDVPFEGQMTDIEVWVKGPNESMPTKYDKYDNLFLIPADTKGFVSRKSIVGRRVFFGNGLIGYQPSAGSIVYVIIKITLGLIGNVIPSTITKGPRIYSSQSGVTTVISYNCTNPSTATNGKDEESLQEIKTNSIASLTSLNRLVSEDDYKNFSLIVKDLPIFTNTVAVLKRSDLKINEIQLFLAFKFDDGDSTNTSQLVPAKNIYHTVPNTTEFIGRDTVINFIEDGVDYITLFDMTIDAINNSVGYSYVVKKLVLNPLFLTKTEPDIPSMVGGGYYDLDVQTLTIERIGDTVKFRIQYKSDEILTNDTALSCGITISENNIDRESMTHTPMTIIDGNNSFGYFEYIFPDITVLKSDILHFFFEFKNSLTSPDFTKFYAQYENSAILKQNLSLFMMSNGSRDDINSTYTFYDIPVIKKSYMDRLVSLNDTMGYADNFESVIIQQFLNNVKITSYRMMTDFVNIKFCNTTGKIKNMIYNKSTRKDVEDFITEIPTNPFTQIDLGKTYILNNNTLTGDLTGKNFNFITLVEVDDLDSNNNRWVTTEPNANDIVFVKSKGTKYIFAETGWMIPNYNIPLKISAEVYRNIGSNILEGQLIENIIVSLLDRFQVRFGPNMELFRSEIIETIQNIEGVSHCRLITPESNIFFNYNIDEFDQDTLLKYSPEWVYFTSNDIKIKVLNS